MASANKFGARHLLVVKSQYARPPAIAAATAAS
jgi:hypothetical protein